MGQDRTIANLPAPRLFETAEERHKYDQRVYDAMVALHSRVDDLAASTTAAIKDSVATATSNLLASKAIEHVYVITDSYSISNSASEDFFAFDDDIVIKSWAEGRAYRLHMSGVLSTTGSPTLALRIRAGSQLLLSTGNILIEPDDGASGETNAPWWVDAVITCREDGSSGVVVTNGRGLIASGGLATALGNSTTTTLDLSAGVELVVSAQWSAASTSNVATIQMLTLERMPAP